MSLRLRLVLLFSGLLLVTVLTIGWWLNSLSKELFTGVGKVAYNVGESVVAVFAQYDGLKLDKSRPHIVRHRSWSVGDDEADDREFEFTVDDRTGNGKTEITMLINGKRVSEDELVSLDFKGPLSVTRSLHTMDVSLDENVEKWVLEIKNDALDHRISIPKSPIAGALARFRQQLLGGLVFLLVFGTGLSYLVISRATNPLRALQKQAAAIGTGQFGEQIPVGGSTEIEESIVAFNQMSTELARLHQATEMLRGQQQLGELAEVGRGLAHSLRNPLNVIGLSVEKIASLGEGSEESRALVRSVRQQINRIDQAIRAFLSLADTGATHVEAVDILEVIQDISLEMIQGSDSGVSVQINTPETRPVLLGIGPEIRSIIQAIVVNACESGTTEPVSVDAFLMPGGGVRITVCDAGSGVSDAVRERLFQPHVTTKEHGSGMGLFLVQRMVTLRYGGKIELRDRVGSTGTSAVLDLYDRELRPDQN